MLAAVLFGTLTRTLWDCSVETSTAGDTVLEPAGPEHVHIGRNLGPEPVVLYAAYLVPEDSPLAVAAGGPGCGPPCPPPAPRSGGREPNDLRATRRRTTHLREDA